MIDSGQSFLCDVITKMSNKEHIVDPIGMREVIFDCSYFLGGQEYSWSIQEKIEGMLRHSSFFVRIILGDLCVQMKQILVITSEELKFALVIDLCNCVDPIHLQL